MSQGIQFVPNAEHIAQIENLAAHGVPWDGIGRLLGVCGKTLRRRDDCQEAYDRGIHTINFRIAGTLAQKALAGDNTCMIFWLKTRARWSERVDVARVELTGKDGAPLYANAHDKFAALARGIIEHRTTIDVTVEPDTDGG